MPQTLSLLGLLGTCWGCWEQDCQISSQYLGAPEKRLQYQWQEEVAQSTVYHTAKLLGLAKITHKFLEVVATHAEVCQVADGKLRGRNLKQLIRASIAGIQHEVSFQVESVWRKVCQEFGFWPMELLQLSDW